MNLLLQVAYNLMSFQDFPEILLDAGEGTYRGKRKLREVMKVDCIRLFFCIYPSLTVMIKL